jgi:hypothetical protein
MKNLFKLPLKWLSILLIKYLQKRYKQITINNKYNQTNQIISKLKLIQYILYYFKSQFSAWGYFHPDCNWSQEDEIYFRKLFPQKDFEEFDIIVWYNPAAVTYYHNKIWELSNQRPPIYEREIKKQLIKWKDWN